MQINYAQINGQIDLEVGELKHSSYKCKDKQVSRCSGPTCSMLPSA